MKKIIKNHPRTEFKKGHTPWNKGGCITKETKMKISLTLKGKKPSEKSKIKNRLAHLGKKNHFYGKHHSKNSKLKISLANKGRKLSKETRKKISLYQKEKYVSKETKEKFREWRKTQILPVKDTKIEVKIQNFLKQLGIEYFTHQYMKEIEHSYQCDILIPSMNMVIECDGDYWHKYPIGNDVDHIRTKELIEKGFKVLRLWEFEIRKMDVNEFKQKIMELR